MQDLVINKIEKQTNKSIFQHTAAALTAAAAAPTSIAAVFVAAPDSPAPASSCASTLDEFARGSKRRRTAGATAAVDAAAIGALARTAPGSIARVRGPREGAPSFALTHPGPMGVMVCIQLDSLVEVGRMEGKGRDGVFMPTNE